MTKIFIEGIEPMTVPLSLATLRKANTLRLPLFKNAQGQPAHAKPDGSDWSPADWVIAILGEVGEAANLLKKIRRGDMTMEQANSDLGDELADIVTYTDIASYQYRSRIRLMVDFGEVKELTNFALIRETNQIVLGKNKNQIGELSDMMNALNIRLGIIGGAIEAVRLKQATPEQVLPRLANEFSLMVGCLDIISIYAGIDLGTKVASKFNRVSQRVDADVFIFEDDTVRNSAGDILELGTPEEYARVAEA